MSQRRRPIRRMSIKDIKTEPGSEDLLKSPAMQPYVRLALASVKGESMEPALAEIAALPLEKRYVWRVASALKWAFADYDSLNVAADRGTLTPEDKERITDLLEHRPIQFCLFLTALFGEAKMQQMMIAAISGARDRPGGPDPLT